MCLSDVGTCHASMRGLTSELLHTPVKKFSSIFKVTNFFPTEISRFTVDFLLCCEFVCKINSSTYSNFSIDNTIFL